MTENSPDGTSLPRVGKELAPPELLNVILWLSCLLMLVASDKSVYLATIAILAAILSWLFPSLIRDPRLWLAAGILQVVRNVMVWTRLDDHIAVANYWSFALALSLASPRILSVARGNARWILALVFLFATGWKATSAEYVTGAFFEYTLLLDDRFLSLARWVGGVPTESLAENYRQMALLRDGALPGFEFVARSTDQAHRLAQFLTWWTVIIEGAVTATFLVACLGWITPVRNWLMVLFAATTYVPVPVTGFCAVLMVLGFAQCQPNERRSRWAYGGVFFAALLWTPIWHLLH